jgi:ATP-binding cassette, subfamily G (WHITE), member 2
MCRLLFLILLRTAGPTGCGKSSLLDILADRKDPRGLSGLVLVDGALPPHSYKYIVGYVVQDDIISGTLTVRENLMFSANVRLSNEIDDVERRARVDKVIADLALETCADTKIGTEFIRGVSGGERRRACIGMELVLSPKILFLDEPTTGKRCGERRADRLVQVWTRRLREV